MSDVEAKKQLRKWLSDNGYLAYPHEMIMGGFCDVVGYKQGEFYAFEIKQKGDRVSKALEQLYFYSRYAHYCIVVADKITDKMAKRFEEKGYGVWVRKGEDYEEIIPPKLMEFINIDDTRRKFQRYFKSKVVDEEQVMIEDLPDDPTTQTTFNENGGIE